MSIKVYLFNLKFIFVFAAAIVSGCCMLNNDKEGNMKFEKHMDSLIGKPIGEGYHGFTLKGYQDLVGVVYEIVDYNGQKVYRRKYPSPAVSFCTADFLVNVDTGLIAGWYYGPEANPKYCVRYEHRCW